MDDDEGDDESLAPFLIVGLAVAGAFVLAVLFSWAAQSAGGR